MHAAMRSRATVSLGAVVMVLSTSGWPAAAPAATSKKAPTATSSLKSLISQTQALPSTAVGKSRRARLLRLARHARSTAARRPCVSVKDLATYRRAVKTTKVRASLKRARRNAARARLAKLSSTSAVASRRLLAGKRTKTCGGGVAPSTLSSTKTSVLSSDENGMRVRVQLPELRFVPQTGGGKTWTRLALPQTDSPQTPGAPGIPVASSVLAVPDGATLDVQATDTTSVTIDGVDVYPAQNEAADQAPGLTPPPSFVKPPFTQPPFSFDKKAYSGKSPIPAAPAFGKLLGQARDLNIAGLHVPAAQYFPATGRLRVLKSVVVKITFNGGPKTFNDQVGSPWEAAQNRIANSLINAAVVKKGLRPIVVRPCGAEMLVITNPSVRGAADTFAAARSAAGISTLVKETGDGAGQIGSTATAIQTYIRSTQTTIGCIHPSYVTILGDDELVPTFTTGPGGIPSDNPYSTRNDTDELPDIAVGRILGADRGQLDAAIAKIIHYETVAPTGAMLTKAVVAAQFQDTDEAGEVNDGQEDRTFVQFAETVRNGLTARGVAVDRIYQDSPATTPLRFNDGTDLPAALKKPTFAWDGDGADVSAAWNEGRFLVVHRDHGWSDGWGDPSFTTTQVDALTNTNDNLPVVMSINCASAQYDTDETSFTQNALVKPTGGAVGVFGDTRNSPSWHNSQIALGFVDALLPTVLGGEGPASKQRVGDALIHGKLRLAGLAPPSGPGIPGGDGNTRNELYLWHYFGDPTMQMWGGGSPPIIFNPAVFKALYKKPGPNPDPYFVEVTFPAELKLAGQPISLLRNGQVIGKALAGDGSVTIPATFGDNTPKPGELAIALEADGAQPVQAPVGDVPPAPTTLTQNCPSGVVFNTQGTTSITVPGTLAGAPEGSTVAVTFKAPNDPNGGAGRTVVVEAKTDAKGGWSATVTTTNRAELGTWTVSSKYAGAPGIAASESAPCSINVHL